MKKVFSMILILLMLLGYSAAMAEDTGIQIIGGSETGAETVNLDDWKEGDTARISGFGEITLVSCSFVDTIPYSVYTSFNVISANKTVSDGDAKESFISGSAADYLRIRVHILNIQKKPFDYYKVFGDEILCTFGDDYKFGGWTRQERKVDDRFWVMYESKDSSYAIDSLYEGYFDVVVTLPNYVVNSKEPLSVTFSIGDNEFTVHIRK